jgi:hypothetical protein
VAYSESGGQTELCGGSEKEKALGELENALIIWAVLGSKAISDAWTELAHERPPEQVDFAIRAEMLHFLLHMVNRYSFDAGGPQARATIQDSIVVKAIRTLITTSFDSSGVKPGFDTKAWEARFVNDLLEDYNDAEMDYSQCKKLGVEGRGDFAREDTILGKLAARINRLGDFGYSIELRLAVWATALECLAKSGIKEKVEEICRLKLV